MSEGANMAESASVLKQQLQRLVDQSPDSRAGSTRIDLVFVDASSQDE